jgi:release factor glutamine methyltransferase
MRRLLVHLLHPILRRWYTWSSSRRRRYRRDGLDLVVLPGVFHPGLFVSTGLMAEHVSSLDLRGRTFLELGAGSGRVALIAARKGAVVTASDVSAAAIENTTINASRNRLPVNVVRSDLFEALPQHFDVIVINPPYYPPRRKERC